MNKVKQSRSFEEMGALLKASDEFQAAVNSFTRLAMSQEIVTAPMVISYLIFLESLGFISLDGAFAKLNTKVEKHKCSICKRDYVGHGNNAQPINKGRCCDDCNGDVIAARLNTLASSKSNQLTKKQNATTKETSKKSTKASTKKASSKNKKA